VWIGEMRGLERLDLSWCDGLGEAAFAAIGRLGRLKSLAVARTRFCDADAARVFEGLPALEELDVSMCAGVSGELFRVLQAGLQVLRARGPHFMDNDVSGAVLGSLRDLKGLYVSAAVRLTSWAGFVGVGGRLQVLDVSWSGLGDACVEEALGGMQELRELDVSGCVHVGNGTAAAVGKHGMLERVGIGRKGVDAGGLRLLARALVDGKLRWVNLRGCAAAKGGTWAEAAQELERAAAGRLGEVLL
jgi:hypothetical protein